MMTHKLKLLPKIHNFQLILYKENMNWIIKTCWNVIFEFIIDRFIYLGI